MIDITWIKALFAEYLQYWFDDLEKVLAKFNIKPENIYNINESEFAINEKEIGRFIINAYIYKRFQVKLGYQE